MSRRICVDVSDTVYALLEVLTHAWDDLGAPRAVTVEDVVHELIDHAQQGVYRPGSWERGWLRQAFGAEWEARLEPGDPYGRDDATLGSFFERPRRA